MRVSTTYKLAGPKTFRRASTAILDKWGTNLQNAEKSIRSIYLPDGYNEEFKGRCKYYLETGDYSVFNDEELETIRIFINRDQAGAEALIVAYECDPLDYRKLFIHGVKPHVYVALKLFLDVWKAKVKEYKVAVSEDDIDILNVTPIENLKNNPAWKPLDSLIKKSDNWSASERYYYLAKQTCHSANYGIEGGMFQMNILEKSGGKISLAREDATMFLDVYRGLFPEIPERNNRIRRQVETNKVLFNLFGFPYYITNYNIIESTFKEYYAWSAQSTVGEITRIAFTNLQEYIWDTHKRWDVLQDNHDSYLCQCRLQEVKECMQKMGEFMNIPLVSPADGAKFNMRSEAQIGFNWGPHKDGVNDLGLREINW